MPAAEPKANGAGNSVPEIAIDVEFHALREAVLLLGLLDERVIRGPRIECGRGARLPHEVEIRLLLGRQHLETKRKSPKAKAGTAAAQVAGDPLFEALRAKRKELAQAQGVPPYVVFADKTLAAMVAERPQSLAEFARLPGVGEAKLERYGEAFMAVIREMDGKVVGGDE